MIIFFNESFLVLYETCYRHESSLYYIFFCDYWVVEGPRGGGGKIIRRLPVIFLS